MSTTLMRHPDNPDDIKKIPLNEWARYRRKGWEFCNEMSRSLADAAKLELEPTVQEDKKPQQRRTTKKKDEDEDEDE